MDVVVLAAVVESSAAVSVIVPVDMAPVSDAVVFEPVVAGAVVISEEGAAAVEAESAAVVSRKVSGG